MNNIRSNLPKYIFKNIDLSEFDLTNFEQYVIYQLKIKKLTISTLSHLTKIPEIDIIKTYQCAIAKIDEDKLNEMINKLNQEVDL